MCELRYISNYEVSGSLGWPWSDWSEIR